MAKIVPSVEKIVQFKGISLELNIEEAKILHAILCCVTGDNEAKTLSDTICNLIAAHEELQINSDLINETLEINNLEEVLG